MSEETLLSAARRVVRFFKIDETRGGGLISRETIQAVDTLSRMVRKTAEEQACAERSAAPIPGVE